MATGESTWVSDTLEDRSHTAYERTLAYRAGLAVHTIATDTKVTPTVRQVAAHIGRSSSTTLKHLRLAAAEGWLREVGEPGKIKYVAIPERLFGAAE